MAQDLRVSLRRWARDPVSTLVIVAILALCIGANTVVFSSVYAKLLRPLSYADPERLVQVWEVSPAMDYSPSSISPFNYLDWKRANQTLEAIGVYQWHNFALSTPEGPRRVRGAQATADVFRALGVSPDLGRLPSAEHDRPGSDVALLSHSAWQQRFAGDPGILGSKVILDGRPFTVLGVMPESFRYPSPSIEVWTTPGFELAGLQRSDHFLFGVARLRPGVSLEEAQGDLSQVAADLERTYPGVNKDADVLLQPLTEHLRGDNRSGLLILWAGVVVILVIACVNLANLLMARVAARRRELSMRIALGGSRWRVVRQLMTESLLLSAVGGTVGLLLAVWVTRLLAAGYGPRALTSDLVEVNAWVLGFSLLVILLTTVLFGTGPALSVVRDDIARHLGQARSVASGDGAVLPRVLIACQVALAVVLLIGAGLLTKSFVRLSHVDPGFDTTGVLTLSLSVPVSEYATPEDRARLYRRVVARIAAVPGVENAAGVNDLPLSGSRSQSSVELPDARLDPDAGVVNVDYRTVTPEYFEVLRLEVEGPGFDATIGSEAPLVVVVNRAFKESYMDKSTLPVRELGINMQERRIVGVVENIYHSGPDQPPLPEIYVPMEQGQPPQWLYLVLRSQVPPESLAPMLVDAVSEVLPDHPLYNITTLQQRLDRSVAPQRSRSLIFALFAAMALILVLLGVYGLVSFTVRRRNREIALRIALGGKRGEILWFAARHGLVPALVGIVVGVVLSMPFVHWLRSLLFEIQPTDPGILILAPLVLASAATLAGYLPARRASRLDPSQMLRDG